MTDNFEQAQESRHLTVSDFYKDRFGCKVYKISLDIGCTCPNRDGSVGKGGCTFCSVGGSGEFAEKIRFSQVQSCGVQSCGVQLCAENSSEKRASCAGQTCGVQLCGENSSEKRASCAGVDIQDAVERAKNRVIAKMPSSKNKTNENTAPKFIAYFQSFTNTYESGKTEDERTAEFKRLCEIFTLAANSDGIVGIAIGTRPDCLSDRMLSFLADLSERTFVQLEFGLQTSNNRTAVAINRCYPTEVYDRALSRVKKIAPKIHIVTHLIFGLPDETKEDMMESVRHTIKNGTDGIKITCLHILRGTKLEEEYEKGKIKPLSMEEYFDLLESALKLIPQNIVIHRLTGDGDKKILLAPMWTANKKNVLNAIKKL